MTTLDDPLPTGLHGPRGAWLELLLDPGDRRAGVPLLALDLAELARLDATELEVEFGLGAASARRLSAAFALGRAVLEERRPPRRALRGPRAVFELLAPHAAGLEQETFWSLLLDGKQRLKRLVPITSGTLTASLVHPREVFRGAVRAAAAALIVVHNHPSGDPEPSAEDLAVTERLRQAGAVLGIPLLDHVIVGAGEFVSLRERGLLPA
ncbi:MAG TPA: DNA repair protein RadC [Planctomycetota bacterium]